MDWERLKYGLRSLLNLRWRLFYAAVLRQTLFRFRTVDGIDVVEEDWDILVVLDGCRYDFFEETNDIPGELKEVKSNATSTFSWLKENFPEYHDDIVYVSSNVFCSDKEMRGFRGSEHFHHIEPVWDYGFDEELGTVPPEEVTEAALRTSEEYPEKRMVVHYLQPHEPFIGETKIEREIEDWEDIKHVWTHPDIREAYRDNLDQVLDEVERLVQNLEGEIVVTADHGELFGKYGLFRHPDGVYLPELLSVPWLKAQKEG